MDRNRLNGVLEYIKSEMGEGLNYFSLIWKETGESLIGVNVDPIRDSFVLKAYEEMKKTIDIDTYTIFEEEGGDIFLAVGVHDVLVLGKFDPKKIMTGMVMGVLLPKFRKAVRAELDR